MASGEVLMRRPKGGYGGSSLNICCSSKENRVKRKSDY